MIKSVLNSKVLTQHNTGYTYKLYVLIQTMTVHTHL